MDYLRKLKESSSEIGEGAEFLGADLQNGLDKFTNFKNDFNKIYDNIISLVDTV